MKSVKKLWSNESGASTIVEASFVFPIMFFVMFFLIFMGNAYYLKASVDDIANRRALEGALRVQDPLYEYVNGESAEKEVNEMPIYPYRYIFTGSIKNSVVPMMQKKVIDDVSAASGLLSGMKPVMKNKSKVCEWKNSVLYSTFVVRIEYTIQMPWKFVWTENPIVLSLKARAEEPIDDTPEFIRNINMGMDLLEATGVTDKIESAFNKVSEFVKSFGKSE